MKKYILDLKVVSVEPLSDKHVLIKLTDDKALPEILPGQFVEVRVDHSPATMLRRPISINFVDREQNQLWLLVAVVGDGTRQLSKLQQGDVLNCMLPLGNGFTMPTAPGQRYLLVGGGAFGSDCRHELVVFVGDEILCGNLRNAVDFVVCLFPCGGSATALRLP